MPDFYTGYRASVRRPDELITAIEVPRVEGAQWFRKVGTRAAQSISKVVMAAVRDGRPRIALGSVAPTIVRARRTEEALAAGATLAEAQAILQQEISPIDASARPPPTAAKSPPACSRSSVGAQFGRLGYLLCAASFSRAFATSRWNTNSLSAFSDRSVKFQFLPPLCFTFSSFFR